MEDIGDIGDMGDMAVSRMGCVIPASYQTASVSYPRPPSAGSQSWSLKVNTFRGVLVGEDVDHLGSKSRRQQNQ